MLKEQKRISRYLSKFTYVSCVHKSMKKKGVKKPKKTKNKKKPEKSKDNISRSYHSVSFLPLNGQLNFLFSFSFILDQKMQTLKNISFIHTFEYA